MTDEQISPQDATPAKPDTTPCVCGDTVNCCSGCSCTKTCTSCGIKSRPSVAPVQKDAWSMFAVGALCGLLFGVLLLMIVALDGGHDSYEDACHPRHQNSHDCHAYMYHHMLQQSSSMPGWGMAENNDMYNHGGKMCGMMGHTGQMSSSPTHSPCVMQGPVTGGTMEDMMGGMIGGMTSSDAAPQPNGNSGWSSNDPAANSQAQQDAAARYTQEKANFDKFLMDETVKFEASIKGVKDPAEREMRQKDFQSWLRDRQAEFNARNASKG